MKQPEQIKNQTVITPELFLYGQLLASVNFERDARRFETICIDKKTKAKQALEIFNSKQK